MVDELKESKRTMTRMVDGKRKIWATSNREKASIALEHDFDDDAPASRERIDAADVGSRESRRAKKKSELYICICVSVSLWLTVYVCSNNFFPRLFFASFLQPESWVSCKDAKSSVRYQTGCKENEIVRETRSKEDRKIMLQETALFSFIQNFNYNTSI